MTRYVHRLAAEDLRQAASFYRREGGTALARRFLDEFERSALLLEQFPEIGTPTTDGRRTFPFGDFPYSVIYRHDDNALCILVVRHQSRDPEFGGLRR